jgi:hypothetical protein
MTRERKTKKVDSEERRRERRDENKWMEERALCKMLVEDFAFYFIVWLHSAGFIYRMWIVFAFNF